MNCDREPPAKRITKLTKATKSTKNTFKFFVLLVILVLSVVQAVSFCQGLRAVTWTALSSEGIIFAFQGENGYKRFWLIRLD
jgi:hypothetical protein